VERTKQQAPDSKPRRRGPVVAAVVVVFVGLVAVVWRLEPWLPIRYGRADPPVVAIDGLEPVLAAAVRRGLDGIEAAPYSAAAWGELGGVLDVHDLKTEAIVCYERAERLDPGDGRWPYFLGLCRRLSDQRAALVDFIRAAEDLPDHAPLQVYLGQGFLALEDLDRAEAHLRRAAEIDPGLMRVAIGLGQVLLGRGDAGGALVFFDNAVGMGAKAAEVHWLRAEAYRRLDNAHAARKAEIVAGDADGTPEPLPDSVRDQLRLRSGVTIEWRRRRSELALRAGRTDAAVAEWETALRDDPDSADLYAELGVVLIRAGRKEAAIAALEAALARDPDRPRVRNNLGQILFDNGEVDRALVEFRASAAALPDDADAHINLARALVRAAPREAPAAYERVIEIRPDWVRAHFEYGLSLARTGRLDDAVTAFRHVVDVDPGRVAAYTNLVRALDELDRRGEAIAALRGGLRLAPGNAQITNDLAWRLATCPDPAYRNGLEAQRLIMSVLDGATGDPLLLDTLAAACAETGDFDAALGHVETAITLLERRPAGGGRTLLPAMRARADLYAHDEPFRAGQ